MEASQIFNDPLAIRLRDEDHSAQEERWVTLGQIANYHLIVTIHTWQEDRDNIYVRIISASRATAHEIRNHSETIKKGDPMREEYDFSKGERGKFYRPNAKVHLPVYLDDDVQAALLSLAAATGKDYSAFINELLKKDIEQIQMAR